MVASRTRRPARIASWVAALTVAATWFGTTVALAAPAPGIPDVTVPSVPTVTAPPATAPTGTVPTETVPPVDTAITVTTLPVVGEVTAQVPTPTLATPTTALAPDGVPRQDAPPAPAAVPAPFPSADTPAAVAPAPGATPTAAPTAAGVRRDRISAAAFRRAAEENARDFAFPFVLAALVVAFLAVHARAATRDPRLAAAPIDDDLRSFR